MFSLESCMQSNWATIKLSSLHHMVNNYTWVLHRKKNMLRIFIIQRWFIVISLINQSPPLEDWRKNIKFSVPVTQPLLKEMSQRPESVLEKEKSSLQLHYRNFDVADRNEIVCLKYINKLWCWLLLVIYWNNSNIG